MPKTTIDYKNTNYYLISCNDKNVTEKYIGFTTNILQCRYAHKYNCTNKNSKKYGNYLYDVIRYYKGWNNWTLEILATHNLSTHYEAKQKELEYINLYEPSINFFMLQNNTKKIAHDNSSVENISDKIIVNQIKSGKKWQKVAKNYKNYKCQKCNYFTNKKNHYEKHIKTIKHIEIQIQNEEIHETPNQEIHETQNQETIKMQIIEKCENVKPDLFCKKCEKPYRDRSGLWRHSKICSVSVPDAVDTIENSNINTNIVNNESNVSDTNNLTNLVMKLLSQNQELTQQIMELSKQQIVTNASANTINNNINNINNNFSINVFLHEKCKDALNIKDFVDTLVLGVSDLEETARLGYANGISKIFINGLKKLDVYKRPLHCSDLKRSTLYIKDDNQWVKDEKTMLTKAIKNVSSKNHKNIFEWQKMNPEYNDSNSKQNDKYNKIICETMSGSSNEEQANNYEKIMKNIIKEVTIEKVVSLSSK
jgi:hypothetical protein